MSNKYKPRQSQPRLVAKAIVFSILSIIGAGLVVLVTIGKVDWVFPSLIYGAMVYFAWDNFFNTA